SRRRVGRPLRSSAARHDARPSSSGTFFRPRAGSSESPSQAQGDFAEQLSVAQRWRIEMASPITFGGLASGLDTKSIIAALVGVEGQKVTSLQTRQSNYKTQLTAYETFLGKLNSLQSALEKISDPGQFLAFASHLSTGGDAFLSATPTGNAHAGNYDVAISKIAQSTFIRSDGFDDGNAAVGAVGTLTLRVGTTDTDITIDGTNNSLFGIRDAINDSDAAVSA